MASGYPNPHNQWGPKETYYVSKPSTTVAQVNLPSLFNDMFFLGFHDQVARWDAMANVKKPSSFPPYNIIKVDEDTYKVELAVAGYSKDDIDVTVEKDQLTVSSKDREVADDETVIHQGIAERQWTQKFFLGEYMEVAGANMKDGLLTITVERHVPEELKPKAIKIK